MNLFKKKPPIAGEPGYAAIVCKSYHVMVQTMSVENNITVNSISTTSLTLRPLRPDQTPKDLTGGSVSLAMSVGGASNVIGDAPDAQLLQFNGPNWLSVICAQEGMVYFDLIPVPIFIDPATGKILRVDVEKFVIEQEHNRQRASEIWGETEGVFAGFHQLKRLPGDVIEVTKEVASLPKTWINAVRGMFNDEPAEPIPDHLKPDMSAYPPIAGIDYDTWMSILAEMTFSSDRGTTYAELAADRGFTPDAWNTANTDWMKRVQSDWKLGAQYGSDVQRIQIEAKKRKS